MSEIKVNKITPRVACGTTQLGDSGDTITIPSGATITNAGTASGFGATGETSWDTTVKTTGTFTATAGVGYFLNTTGGTITVNLPVGAAGSSVALADYAATWQTNNVTVAANGTEKIGGVDADITLSTEGQAVTFVYIDGTQGWVNVLDSTSNVRANAFIVATGGTPCSGTICGDYKIHTFTGPGTFTVSNAGAPAGSDTVDYLVVAGGASGGQYYGGGGGAGGFRESVPSPAVWTGSPLANPGGAIPVSVTGYPITVGGGGPEGGCTAPGNDGTPSIFSSITSAGGGAGAGTAGPAASGNSGGSGGGSSRGAVVASGNTPPVSPPQGQPGGITPGDAAGGGGATVAGGDNIPNGAVTPGGAGAGTAINPSPSYGTPGPSAPLRYFAGGGASAVGGSVGGVGGGGSQGGPAAGTINTGGGGSGNTAGRTGGSGIVIIRYKFQ